MQRGLAMAAFGADAMERESSPSSWSSSGCQSGWTLYLDHSNNDGGARYVSDYGDPAAAAAQRWVILQQAEHAYDEEDSMASDASSGPRPRSREEDGDEARRAFGFIVAERGSYSTTSSRHSGGASGSGSFGASSTWLSRSSQGGVDARTAAAVSRGEATSRRRYRREVIVIDDDGNGELDDTASSSAVFSCPMLHAC